jgi:hypothetical protein
MSEIDEKGDGYQAYLRARAGIHDPRISAAVLAANSMRRAPQGAAQMVTDRCLRSMASSYAGSRMDPFLHTAGGLRDFEGGEPYSGGRVLARAGVSCAHDPRRSKVDVPPLNCDHSHRHLCVQAEYHSAAYARVDAPNETAGYGNYLPATAAHHARGFAQYGPYDHM